MEIFSITKKKNQRHDQYLSLLATKYSPNHRHTITGKKRHKNCIQVFQNRSTVFQSSKTKSFQN